MARSIALAIGADHRDEHQVPRTGPRGGPDQVPRLVLVTLGGSRAVDDDLGPCHRGFDLLARAQIAGHELDTVRALVTAPAEYPQLACGLEQTWYDEPPERPGATGYQDG